VYSSQTDCQMPVVRVYQISWVSTSNPACRVEDLPVSGSHLLGPQF
jgi:hypothetical protein